VRVLVVYESMYGNTAKVAAAIAEGLGPDAETVEVGAAPSVVPADVELLVVGGPTHAHGMSQPTSRHDAADRGDRAVVSRGNGIREWIASVSVDRPILYATFDTRVPGPKILWGSAADAAAKALRARGLREAHPPVSLVLDGLRGSPYDRLPEAELERARDLGRQLAGVLVPAR
jgi:hypothetical protein